MTEQFPKLESIQDVECLNIDDIYDKCKKALLDNPKIKINYQDMRWPKTPTPNPGIYAIFDDTEPTDKPCIYIGQSADVLDRINDLRMTYNHSVRQKIGHNKYGIEIEAGSGTSSKKFKPEEVEKNLSKYMEAHITITAVLLPLGRLEIEQRLIKEMKPRHNDRRHKKRGN